MYICICNAITESEIKQEVGKGACSLQDLCQRLKVGDSCGCCCQDAEQVLKTYLDEKSQKQT